MYIYYIYTWNENTLKVYNQLQNYYVQFFKVYSHIRYNCIICAEYLPHNYIHIIYTRQLIELSFMFNDLFVNCR